MIGFNLGHLFKHKLTDSLQNLKSSFIAEYRALTGKNPNPVAYPPNDYVEVLSDYFNEPLDMNKWGYAHPWGDFHPGSLHQYYDNDGTLTRVTEKGLELELKYLPKTWNRDELMPEWRRDDPRLPEVINIDYGVGHLHSRDAWQYGWFEAWIKLPEGINLWPAFWLTGAVTWPPEIDILEAYSHLGPRYEGATIGHWFKRPFRKIKPNMHYGVPAENTKGEYGAWDVSVKDCTERFVQYACLWEEDRIEIYYDGLKVFQCTDPEILAWYNRNNAQMYMVLNHAVNQKYPDNPTESTMYVDHVRVLQKNQKAMEKSTPKLNILGSGYYGSNDPRNQKRPTSQPKTKSGSGKNGSGNEGGIGSL